jgi:hypothetical protein
VVSEVFGVAPHTGEEARLERVHPVQPEEVEAWPVRDTAVLNRSALLVEDWDPQPAEIVGVAGRPDDRCDVLPDEVESINLSDGGGKTCQS